MISAEQAASFLEEFDACLENETAFFEVTQLAMIAEMSVGALEADGDITTQEADDQFRDITRKIIMRTLKIAESDDELWDKIFTPGKPSMWHKGCGTWHHRRLKQAIMDNHLWAAIHAVMRKHKSHNSLDGMESLVFDAAYNKNRYGGYGDEVFIVRMLIQEDFDVNYQDPSNGYTPLHLMTSSPTHHESFPRIVKRLLNAGADANVANIIGDTPLILMSADKRFGPNMVKSAKYLLEAGADPEIKSQDGMAAIHLLEQQQKEYPTDDRAAVIHTIRAA
jgi:hypothetical protein